MSSTARQVHTVHYPETDHMGEDFLQRIIAESLRPLIARWLKSRRVKAFTGADQFLYWVPGDPTQRVAPDVYVLPKVDPGAVPPSWQLWEVGVAPSFALEVVSRNVAKDYEDAPAEYAAMGAKELVIFDPGATARSRTRVRWQVYRRLARRGFVRVAQTMDDRVEVASLGCWLVAVGSGREVRLRLGTGAGGAELFPTEAEAETARAEAEARARAEAEAEVARLRTLLAAKR
ncbi:MAG: Uma2 family endonuclease [Deltaproteobacteria bacterium]|nr:Uma2 family endonuclease [Myxococcales bacterium]MDP3213281.1 Uma2 family endonuclease [Deltaproteobacteria bacterium]